MTPDGQGHRRDVSHAVPKVSCARDRRTGWDSPGHNPARKAAFRRDRQRQLPLGAVRLSRVARLRPSTSRVRRRRSIGTAKLGSGRAGPSSPAPVAGAWSPGVSIGEDKI